jgi:hypothetical protein
LKPYKPGQQAEVELKRNRTPRSAVRQDKGNPILLLLVASSRFSLPTMTIVGGRFYPK